MSQSKDPRVGELATLKSILDERWKANEAALLKSLSYGVITWRRKKEGGYEVKIKPEL
jgi:hypothetical protein